MTGNVKSRLAGREQTPYREPYHLIKPCDKQVFSSCSCENGDLITLSSSRVTIDRLRRLDLLAVSLQSMRLLSVDKVIRFAFARNSALNTLSRGFGKVDKVAAIIPDTEVA